MVFGRGQDLWEREAGSAASWPVYERSLGSSGGLLQTLSGELGWAAGPLAGQPMGPAATPRWFPGGLRNSSRDGNGSGLQGWVLTLSRRKAGLPMAGLWPCGQSLSQGLAGGDPARVQGVGRPLKTLPFPPRTPGKRAVVGTGAADQQLGESRRQVRREYRTGQASWPYLLCLLLMP